jgi:hypothetical protein
VTAMRDEELLVASLPTPEELEKVTQELLAFSDSIELTWSRLVDGDGSVGYFARERGLLPDAPRATWAEFTAASTALLQQLEWIVRGVTTIQSYAANGYREELLSEEIARAGQ